MIKVVDNFFKKEDQDFLEETLCIDLDNQFPWFLAHTSNYVPDNYTSGIKVNSGLPFEKDYHQFCHTFYMEEKGNSMHWPRLEKMYKSNKFIKIKSFYRVKANLNVQIIGANEKTHGSLHSDYPGNIYTSVLYYVNDSDGDTLFFNNHRKVIKRVRPKRGRAVVFDSNTLHAASPPLNFRFRVVVNCIFKH
jgi:hypothetical protein|tara:strand:- start:821 stop:1393 length:573 start_codon:yes stop_codon:yes gene_type:complete